MKQETTEHQVDSPEQVRICWQQAVACHQPARTWNARSQSLHNLPRHVVRHVEKNCGNTIDESHRVCKQVDATRPI